MAIRTIRTIVDDCSRNLRPAWEDFVRGCGPVAGKLLLHYFPALEIGLEDSIGAVFACAHDSDNAWLKSLHFTNEREFAVLFRELVFAHGRSTLKQPLPTVGPDTISELLAGLSLIERELTWSFLKGWNPEQASSMLQNVASTAAHTWDTSNRRLSILNPADPLERSLVVLAAMQTAESSVSHQCVPQKTFNNIINGQISWRERELAEQHMLNCLHCVAAFTDFQEMIWATKTAHPLPDSELENILSKVGLQKQRRSLMARLMLRAS